MIQVFFVACALVFIAAKLTNAFEGFFVPLPPPPPLPFPEYRRGDPLHPLLIHMISAHGYDATRLSTTPDAVVLKEHHRIRCTTFPTPADTEQPTT